MRTSFFGKLRGYLGSRRLVAHFLEILILATLFTLARMVCVWFAKEMLPSSAAYLPMGASSITGHLFEVEFELSVLPVLIGLGPVLLFSRIFRRKSLFLIFSLGLPALILFIALYTKFLPVVRMVEAARAYFPEFKSSLSIPVSIFIPMLRMPLQMLLPFLAGLYCARNGFRIWKFALGFLAVGWLLEAAFYGISVNWLSMTIEPPLFLGVAMAALRLPLQRAAFERLFGAPLAAMPAEEPRSCDVVLSSVFGHVAFFLFLALCVFFGFFGHFERKAMRVLQYGPEVRYRSPALVNAYPALKAHFTRSTSAEIPIRKNLAQGFPISPQSFAGEAMPAVCLREFLSKLNSSEMEAQFQDAEPYFAALEGASRADYCLYHEPGRLVLPNFINLRESSRLLAMRSVMRMSQGRFEESLHDIDITLKTGWLLNEDGQTLVTYMVGTAIRGLGIGAAENYFLYQRDNPQALALLEARLPQWKPLLRLEFDFEKVQRGEFGFWPISPFYEIAMPGFIRARAVHYHEWVRYDYLVLAIALENYKAARGEYPETLDALQPDWLERLPLDPYEGKPYIYTREGAEYRLSCAWKSPHFTVDDFPPREANKHLQGFLNREKRNSK